MIGSKTHSRKWTQHCSKLFETSQKISKNLYTKKSLPTPFKNYLIKEEKNETTLTGVTEMKWQNILKNIW